MRIAVSVGRVSAPLLVPIPSPPATSRLFSLFPRSLPPLLLRSCCASPLYLRLTVTRALLSICAVVTAVHCTSACFR
jgi:hypothetical protein